MTSRRTVNYVFFTGTFNRDTPLIETWSKVNNDFNRFVQRFRRATHGNSIHYLRTIEAHLDDYPHIHAVFYFPQAIIVENGRYFDKRIYQLWKGLWIRGLSDYQPTSGTVSHSVYYIVKYITKGSSKKTVWKKMLPTRVHSNVHGVTHTTSAVTAVQNSPTTVKPQSAVLTKDLTTLFLCQQFKIKQVTWSRGFKFPKIDKPLLVSPPQQVLNIM